MNLLLVRSAWLAVVCSLMIAPGCAPKPETSAQMLERAKTLPDPEALILIARARFRNFEEAATLPPSGGKVAAFVTVRGDDISVLPASIVKTAQGGIHNAIKRIQMMPLLRDLDRFLKEGKARNLGDVTLTLKTPTASGGRAQDWIEAYRLMLPAKAVDKYLKTSDLEVDARIAAAERIWKVEFDRFKDFQFTGD